MTADEMLAEMGLCPDDVYVESGDYASGFWKNQIRVNLEKLAADDVSAFAVVENIHDTAGTSFREYYGIDQYADLPHGATGRGIAAFCADIWNRRESLTDGFDTEWDNGSFKAVWAEREDGEDLEEWWANFSDYVNDHVSTIEVYDLADSNNLLFVEEAIRPDIHKLEVVTVDAIEIILHNVYVEKSDDLYVVNYAQAAVNLYERFNEKESNYGSDCY